MKVQSTKQSVGIIKNKKNKEGSEGMVFNTGAALLDAIVLAVVSKEQEGTYGYKITQDVRSDMAYAGRNRRYYKITDKGSAQLNLYKVEWKNYSSKISGLFEGGIEL